MIYLRKTPASREAAVILRATRCDTSSCPGCIRQAFFYFIVFRFLFVVSFFFLFFILLLLNMFYFECVLFIFVFSVCLFVFSMYPYCGSAVKTEVVVVESGQNLERLYYSILYCTVLCCVYIYIYISISLSISLSLYIYIYMYLSLSLYIYLSIYMYIYIYREREREREIDVINVALSYTTKCLRNTPQASA